MKKTVLLTVIGIILCLSWTPFVCAGVQYSNDFENPSDSNPQTAWPEWVIYEGGSMQAVNGRLEWDTTGGNNDWIRLDHELPYEYVFEFDFFFQEGTNGRFSVWPFCVPGDGIFERYNYFLRKNSHFFNGADTIPSEGERDITLPVGSNPHRLRMEVTGDHVAFLYKDQGEGGWILIDERDFPHVDDPRYIQIGYNHDGGDAGLIYADNFVLSYRDQNLFNYSNNFDNAASEDVQASWPEWVFYEGGSMSAVNGRIEWDTTGGNNDWMRLDRAMPTNYLLEFDFYFQEGINGRFSVWPFCVPGDGIFERYNYFLRKNTHFFNGADTIPSEGSRDLTLPVGANPHRLRLEVTGDNVIFLYKDQGEGGWILIDEREFPHVDDPRYIQLGYNHDGGDAGLIYIDNLVVTELAADRAVVERTISATNFEADTPVPVQLSVAVSGNIPSLTLVEGIPEGWLVSDISNNGVVSGGNIVWSFTNQAESLILTYNAIPPRLIRSRVAGFSGSVDSGDGEERIAGETAISIQLPYLYREAIDFDFSGSPVDGKNYPTGYELGVQYTQGMDGIPSDVVYERPAGRENVPAIDDEFDFPADADFHQGTPELVSAHGESYNFLDYRDEGEAWFEHGASDTGSNIGSLDAGDWFRYTFDLGEDDQVLILNMSFNSWHAADNFAGETMTYADVYVDNQFKGECQIPVTDANEYNFFTVGPFEVTGGEHSVVVAFPGEVAPLDFGRMEVVRVQGIGRVERQLTADGFFDPSQPLEVTLKAEALYGSYAAFIDEVLPSGAEVTDAAGGVVEGSHILFTLDPTTTSQTITYTIQAPAGSRFMLFDGLCDGGLPLADPVRGDVSVTNEVWLFGNPTSELTDDFEGSSLGDPWFVEYGSDPALDADYEEGVSIDVADGILTFGADTLSMAEKFNEWSNGRRAPMILRTDVPEGDWRIETSLKLADTYTWDEYHVGLAVTYNDGSDTNVAGDEYMFGFHSDDLRAELSNQNALGILDYHEYTDEGYWFDELLFPGKIEAKIAVTRRGDELIFSAQLPDKSWQLVAPPVAEYRQATRIGLFSKIWGEENFTIAEFDYFTLSELDVFTGVLGWELY